MGATVANPQFHTVFRWAACALCISTIPLTWAGSRYPNDPFSWQYEPMEADEIGTTKGQMQFSILGSLVISSSHDNDYLAGKLSNDYMLNEYGALRFSLAGDLFEADGSGLEHRLSSFRFGSSWHLNPYRAIDIGTYVDAGVAIVDMLDGKSGDKAPEVTLGGFLIYHLDSAFFVRAEMDRTWCNIEINGIETKQHRTAMSLGLGMAF